MSEKLCALRKIGGGTLKETTLWTNSSPSATFAEQTVTLSDNISNYDYIKIEWCESTSALTNKSSIMVSASEFTRNKNPYYNAHDTTPAILGRGANNVSYLRYIAYESDTQVLFGHALRGNATGVDNTFTIPLNIYGVKM